MEYVCKFLAFIDYEFYKNTIQSLYETSACTELLKLIRSYLRNDIPKIQLSIYVGIKKKNVCIKLCTM